MYPVGYILDTHLDFPRSFSKRTGYQKTPRKTRCSLVGVGAAGVEPAVTPTPRVYVAATPCPELSLSKPTWF
jgi:hypothetical protein